jgi:hypothetical protein
MACVTEVAGSIRINSNEGLCERRDNVSSTRGDHQPQPDAQSERIVRPILIREHNDRD